MYNSTTNRDVEMNKNMVIFIGYKYNSFEEYIQLNYLEMIKDSLQTFFEKVEQQEITEETEEIYSSGFVPIISNEKMDGYST